MRLLSCAFAIFFAFSLSAQQKTGGIIADPPEGPVPWTKLSFNNNPERFQFAIVTDRTGGHRPGVFMEGVKRLNLVQPEFVMSVGDFIEGYTENMDELLRQWNEFDGFVDNLDMPFFYVPGNHDITNKVMEDLWLDRYGPTYYSFTYNDVLFMCLNSEDQYRGASRGSISDVQFDWIKETLEANPDPKWTLLFMHQPLWLQQTDPVRWFEVEELLRDRMHTVFVGHRHGYTKYERNNGKYFLLATTGGGSALRGPELGEFDHVVWVTMTEQGPIIANLELSGVWNEDVVTEQTQAFIDKVDAKSPFEVEPLYVENADFQGGKVRLRITNDEDLPMHVELDDLFNPDFSTDLSQGNLTVNPNSVEFIDVELTPRSAEAKAGDWSSVELEGSFTYLGDNTPTVEFPFRVAVAPEMKYPVNRERSSIQIDGNLDEWGTLPNHLAGNGNDGDASMDFDLRYSDDYAYFGGLVHDDDLQIGPEDAFMGHDFAGLVLNADHFRASAQQRGSGNYESSVLFLASPGQGEGQSFYEDRLPEGSKWSSKRTDDGYSLEVAVPIKYIREKQGDDWKTLRLNVILQDKDSSDDETPRYLFQPEWRGGGNRPGSGMFFRQD